MGFNPEEEARAAEARRQREARARYQAARAQAVRGDPAARKAISDAWAPLVLALEEYQNPVPYRRLEVPGLVN